MAIDLAPVFAYPGILLKDARLLNARGRCIRPQRRKAPLCEPLHRRKPMSMAGSDASVIDTARWTHANAPDPVFSGAISGAQFHASGQALRRFPALADQRHHSPGARAGRRPFPTQAPHRLDVLGHAIHPYLDRIAQNAEHAREAAQALADMPRANSEPAALDELARSPLSPSS